MATLRNDGFLLPFGKGLRKACKAGFLLLLQMWGIYSEVEIFSTRKHTAALTSTSLYSPLRLASPDLHQPLQTPPIGQPQSPSASTAPGNFLDTTQRDSPLPLKLCKNNFSHKSVKGGTKMIWLQNFPPMSLDGRALCQQARVVIQHHSILNHGHYPTGLEYALRYHFGGCYAPPSVSQESSQPSLTSLGPVVFFQC